MLASPLKNALLMHAIVQQELVDVQESTIVFSKRSVGYPHSIYGMVVDIDAIQTERHT